MRKSAKSLLFAVALISLAAGFAVTACGSGAVGGGQASPTVSKEMTTAELWADILGHEPTGVAARVLERGEMIVANDANYPPQSSIDPATGELVGFDVDVATRVGELLKIPVRFVNPAWETVPAGLDAGRWDVSIGSMTVTPDRKRVLDFTEPYYYASGRVFVRRGGPQITGPQDLEGKTVGVGAATTYYDYLTKNTKAKVRVYPTDVEAFPDLLNGTIDFVMTAGPTGQEAILEGKEIEASGAPLYYEDLAFAVKKGESDWLALLDYAVKTMHEDGSLSAMSEEWFNGVDLTVKE